ncbi:MAG TPA: CoA pyrophosphatase [Candidatus Binatia bacterium]|jgi:8-oxo-dGTP pyrophosphatase MutT (NUDIX family)
MSVNKIIAALNSRAPQTLGVAGFKLAAVLVPIQQKPDGDHLVLTQRAELLNSHGGQIAFPGGRIDPCDSGPLAAALRESEEEIGLKPVDVRVLGELDQVTAASDYLITPFVGVVPHPYDFRLNEAEARAVFSVPISALLQTGCFKVEPRLSPPDRPYPIYHFYCQGWDIWGATARIILQLLELAYGFKEGDRL